MSIPSKQKAITTLIDKFDAEANSLLADTQILFGERSPLELSLRKRVENERQVWQAIQSAVSSDTAIFAILRQDMMEQPSLIELVFNKQVEGVKPQPGHRQRIRWVGSSQPTMMSPRQDFWKRVDPEDMDELGTDYIWAEARPLDGLQKDMAQSIRPIIAGSTYKIIELREERIELEGWQDWLVGHKGAIVLPVIRLTPQSTQNLEEGRADFLGEWSEHILPGIERKLPGIYFAPPAILPHLQSMGDEDRAWQKARKNLLEALQELIQHYPVDSIDQMAELEASRQEFSLSVANDLEMFRSPLLRDRGAEIEASIVSLPNQAVELLLLDKRRLRSLFRVHLRDELLSKIPDLAFPFKPLTGLLCLSVGAWDKLILASVGSLPSAILGTTKSLKSQAENRAAHRDLVSSVENRIEALARTKLSKPWSGFILAINKVVGRENRKGSEGTPSFKITGIEPFVSTWKAGLQTSYTACAKSRSLPIRTVSFFASLLFLCLISGPLYQVYGEYLTAAYRSLDGQWPTENLANYPTPPAAFWFTTLILSLIPVFFLSLLLVSSCLRKHRVEVGVDRLEKEMKERLRDGSLGLNIEASDPRVKATRSLTALANHQPPLSETSAPYT